MSTITQTKVTTSVQQICPPIAGPILIENTDLSVTAYVSYDQSGSTATAVPIEPLGNVILSGGLQISGFTLTGSALLNILPGGGGKSKRASPNSDSPAALDIVLGSTILAGGTYTSFRRSVTNYQSWFGTLFAYATAAGLGSVPYTRFELDWSVASDNYDTLRFEDWVIPNTPFNFTYQYRHDGLGICVGDTLTVTAFNYDTQPVNLTYGFFGSYRPRARSQLRGRYQFSGGVINEAAGLGSDDILYNTPIASLGAGASTAAALVNLAEGPCQVWGSFPGESAVGAVQVQIQPQPATVLGAAPILLGSRTIAGIMDPAIFAMPRRVCTVVIKNGGSAPITNGYLTIISQAQPE